MSRVSARFPGRGAWLMPCCAHMLRGGPAGKTPPHSTPRLKTPSRLGRSTLPRHYPVLMDNASSFLRIITSRATLHSFAQAAPSQGRVDPRGERHVRDTPPRELSASHRDH